MVEVTVEPKRDFKTSIIFIYLYLLIFLLMRVKFVKKIFETKNRIINLVDEKEKRSIAF
jgi:hypothetical protein